MLYRVAGLLLTLLAVAGAPAAGLAASDHSHQTWLVLSDIHLDPFDRDEYPSRVGSDTNLALFDQTLEQMKHSVPDPSVVLLPGDFLAHGFSGKVHANAPTSTPDQSALRTMQLIASALGKTYPRAHFAIALGNNDASCGDYRSDAGNQYLAQAARIWAPLVQRSGSSPEFVRMFSAGGYYTAASPMPGLRLIVLNTVPMSSEYRGNCGEPAPNVARNELSWLREQLATTPAGTHNVVMMHIPPGHDPVSTQYAHGFLAWSFLHDSDSATLLDLLSNPSSRVLYGIAGHEHRLDFRLDDDVPILIFGSLSPVYRNNPAFYALHVGDNGSIEDMDTYAYDEWSGDWADAPRSFDRKWNVPRINAQSLAALHARLGNDESLRDQWSFGAVAWPSYRGFRWAAWTSRRWRIPWCAQTILGAGYAQCAAIEGRVSALRAVLAAIAIGIAVVVVLVVLAVRRRYAA